jgi:hypothetical protein
MLVSVVVACSHELQPTGRRRNDRRLHCRTATRGGALDEHYGACEKVFGGQHNDLGAEARTRVSQIIWLLTEVGRYLMIGIEAQTLQNEIGAQLSAGQVTNNGMSECSPRR